MAYIAPVEAVTNRLSEVDIASGNLIFDVEREKILYDSSSNKRIDLSSVVVFNTEKELLTSEGIIEKVYLAKDTGSLFYWDGRIWLPIKVASNAVIYDTFYVSPNGSDDNDGLTADMPAKTIYNILNSKATNLSNLTIYILPGTYNEGNLNISNKKYVKIYSEATNTAEMPTINAVLNISNSNFIIDDVKIGKINVTESIGQINKAYINTTTVGDPDSAILVENSLVNINACTFMDNSIAITANRNSVCAVTAISGTGNVVGFYVNNGSVVTLYDHIDITTGELYTLNNGGRIHLINDPTDITTKEYIDNKVGSKADSSHTHDDRYYTETEINDKLSKKADSSHTHSASQINGLPTSLPANGGNSATVNGHKVLSDVPANAKFTDTTYSSASAYASGLVNTGTQTFAGNKTFNGSITATGNITGAKVYNAVWNADYAEGFEYEGDIPKLGEIVELCGNNKVRIASANSNMVIGVCSNTYWALAGCSIDDIEHGTKTAIGIAGQLPIKVRGTVKYGDYIICGGDGIGEACSQPNLGQVVGRAMETNMSPDIKNVICIIQIR